MSALRLSQLAVLAFATGLSPLAAEETIISTHAYSTFGDIKYPADFEHFDFVNPDAPKGGTISFSALGTFNSMNPYATLDGDPGTLSSVMYERILTSSLDEVSADYCLLCTHLEYPESKDWVIFHLRPEARFSDGTPLTAHDLVFSHKLLLDQGTPSYAAYVSQVVASAEALDDHTLKFTFADDIPRKSLIPLVGGTPAWSKTWYEETGARLDQSRLDVSPGSGPYMLERAQPPHQITYRRNPDYWAADLPVMRGRANFDQIRIVYYADSNAAFLGFTSGDYTFRVENSSINWATSYDFPAVENGWVVRDDIADGSLPVASGFVMNLRRDLLQDRDIRLALGLMYNFTFTNETLQFGLFDQRESFWQDSALQAHGVAEGLELELLQSVADLIDPDILTEPVFMPHVSGPRQLDRGNLRRALAHMEAAGYTTGEDGLLRNAAGETLDIEFLERLAQFDRVLLPYIDNLKRLGVNATYRRIDPAQYQLRLQNFDYDMIVGGYNNALEEGIGLSQRFGSEYRQDVFNRAGFASPAIDKLIDKVVEATTREEMESGVRAIDRIMRHEYFVVPTWYKANHWVAHYDMFERPENMPPYALGEIDIWWFNADKAQALRAAGALR